MFCKNCGKQLNDGVKFCGKCGEDQTADTSSFEQIAEQGKRQQNDTVQYNPSKNKNNIVFLVFTILFTIIGMFSYIIGFLVNYDLAFSDVKLLDFDVLLTISIISTGIVLIGIIFAIVALYRKPNKFYLYFSILPCILLVLWIIVLSFWVVKNII